MVNLKVKCVRETSILPTKAHDTDACFDIYADLGGVESIIIHSKSSFKIPAGIQTEIPKGYFAAVFARSGLGIKKHLRLSNSVGIIDADYRGEWVVSLFNDSNTSWEIHQGDRIAQFAILPVLDVNIEDVDELTDTERGIGGFGSSGR